MAVGAVEPQFYAILLEKLGLNDNDLPQFSNFQENRNKLTKIFKQKTQDEWNGIFDGTDACVTPVLSLKDAPKHLHNKQQKSFSIVDKGTIVPNPSPRLSRTPGITGALNHANLEAGEHSREILSEYFDSNDVNDFITTGIVQQVSKKSKL